MLSLKRTKYILFILCFAFFQKVNSQDKLILDAKDVDLLKIMKINDQKYRFHIIKKVVDKKQKDSLWKLQTIIDLKNITQLIELFEKYGGYFDDSNSNCGTYMATFLMHTPKSKSHEIQKIIDLAKSKNKIDYFNYVNINFHLNGRKKFPFSFERRTKPMSKKDSIKYKKMISILKSVKNDSNN